MNTVFLYMRATVDQKNSQRIIFNIIGYMLCRRLVDIYYFAIFPRQKKPYYLWHTHIVYVIVCVHIVLCSNASIIQSFKQCGAVHVKKYPSRSHTHSRCQLHKLDTQTKLKGLAQQAKIIKKSMILFWLLNMTILCKHVHRLELQKFLNFSAAHSPVRLAIKTKFPYLLILTWLSIIRNQEFRLYI